MKRKSRIKQIFLLVVLVLLILALAIHIFGSKALEAGIEAVATKTLNVGVSVGDVDLGIFSGKFGIEDLVVNNPAGYEHETLLELRDARIAVDVKSLLTDTINVREIKLDGMDVVLEQRGVTSNNLQDIIKSIPAKEQAKEEAVQEPEKPGKNLRIDNLEISNVTVKAKLLPVPGKADTVTLKLKPIKMTDLGTDEKMDFAVLSSKILMAILSGIVEQGTGLLPDDLTDSIKSGLTEIEDMSKAALEEGKEVLGEGGKIGKDVLEGAKDLGKDVGEGLKGLFKPKEE